METVKDWDAAEFIETKEDIVAYLEAAMNENDPALLLKAIGAIARSEGISRLAGELNLTAKKNPSFITVLKVLDNLGFQLSIQQKKAS
jgi:probable addiction module antidote protein